MGAYNDKILHNAREIVETLKERCPVELTVKEVWVVVEPFSNKVDIKSARLRYRALDDQIPIDLHVENE